MKIITFAVFAFLWSLILASPTFAVTTPSFPACTSIQGILKVSYPSGIHGIVGSTATYTGSDKVYNLDETTKTQCFCAQDGQGIQTNWWKISSLTDDQRKILENEGWNYIANGALWGLDESAYMAVNSNYTCGGVGGAEQSMAGSVLGEALAGTGNSLQLFSVFILSLIFLTSGIYYAKKAR